MKKKRRNMLRKEISKTKSKFFLKCINNGHDIIIFHELTNYFEAESPGGKSKKKKWMKFLKPELLFQIIAEIVKIMF
jgi:hypothetical protein